MERELWLSLYLLAKQTRVWGPGWRFSTVDILMVYLWAAVHDRPMCWATEPRNWPDDLRPPRLPSQSQLSRRMRGPDVLEIMSEVEDQLRALVGVNLRSIHIIDAKPLEVSNVSKDRDAGYGRSAGGKHKGYKLYAIWSAGAIPSAWGLAPMNVSEKVMAAALIPTLPGEGYLLGDGEYDSNQLYDEAHEAGLQLIAPNRKGAKGLGHRRQSPYRLRSIELLASEFGQNLFRLRRCIECDFGALVCFGGGLTCLPPWVRHFTRVRNWLHAKLLINAVRWLSSHHIHLIAAA
jgi:hypothetical protein